jgi:hypothetical protein
MLCYQSGGREITMNTALNAEIAKILVSNQNRISGAGAADIALQLKGYGKLVPQISFREFGRREIQPVIPGLIQLRNYILNVTRQFFG